MGILGVAAAGCVSSGESGSDRENPIVRTQQEPSRDQESADESAGQQDPGRALLTSKEDTLTASVRVNTRRPRIKAVIKRPEDPAYTVQIAAFLKAANALRYHKAARERFPEEFVQNTYDAETGLYRIGVGKFLTRKDAAGLRRSLMKRFPREYQDAWVNYTAK